MNWEASDPHRWDDIPLEWKEFGSNASFLAFFDRQHGLKKLKAVLALAVKNGDIREFLEEDADKLMVAGIRTIAVLVAQAAKRCPSLADVRFFDWQPSPANIAAWHQSRQRQIGRIRKRREALLRQAGLDPDWQDKIASSDPD